MDRLTLNAFTALRVVIQQFFNKIHVCQHHSTATVSLQAQFVQSISFREISLQQTEICFPFVPNHLSTGETADWDNHLAIEQLQQK
jgi:hypothetical protein